MVEVVSALRQHALLMAPNLRASDVAEVWAAAHHSPREALVHSLRQSVKAWTAMLDGEPIAIWGVGASSLMSPVGSPWLLGTDRVKEVPVQFLRRTRGYIDEMLGMYSELVNFVDARNMDTLRWLEWIGFTISEAQPFGAEGLPFHKIRLRG